jgi:hypothetical protein
LVKLSVARQRPIVACVVGVQTNGEGEGRERQEKAKEENKRTRIEKEKRGRKNKGCISCVAVLWYCLLDFQFVDANF